MSVLCAWIPPPVDTLPRLRPCKVCGSLGSSSPRLLARNFATFSVGGIENEPHASRRLQQLRRNRYRHLDSAFPCDRVSRRRRPRPEAMRCVLLVWDASVCDGACPTLDDAAGLPPTEVPASPPPRLAAISSAVGTHGRDSLKPCSTLSWISPSLIG